MKRYTLDYAMAVALEEFRRNLSLKDEHLVIDREGEIARYHPEPTKGEED